MSKKCTAKHTKVQIPNDEWACPKCGAGLESKNGGFIVDDIDADDEDRMDCELLHEDDLCMCYECGYTCSGKHITNLYIKKNDLVPCPCCAGKGLIPSKKAAEIKEKMK